MGLPARDVSVVICAYTENRWNELNESVASLRRQTTPPGEILVVVDHNPVLLERARAQWADLNVVENSEPRGLGGARNSGVQAAQGKIIAFLDDDAIAAPDWLENLLAAYQDAQVAGVGGATEAIWQNGKPWWFPEEFGWVVGCSYLGMPETLSRVRNLHGCNMSFRREVFERIGRFRLGYGCDEVEFCIRLQQQLPGQLLLYQPRARVRHRVTSSRATWQYFHSRCYFEGGSKAVVSWLVGAQEGLASERTYTLRILPRGILRGLQDALLRGDRSGFTRAVAIASGLAITGVGYLRGRISTLEAARQRGWYEQEPIAVRGAD